MLVHPWLTILGSRNSLRSTLSFAAPGQFSVCQLFGTDQKLTVFALLLSSLDIHPDRPRHLFRTSNPERLQSGRVLARSLSARFANCEVVEVGEAFDGPNQTVAVLADRDVLYVDDDHLSGAGTNVCKPMIRERLQAALDEVGANAP